MEEHEFDQILAVVRRADGCQWEIGDALVEICGLAPQDGVNDGRYARMQEVDRNLWQYGFVYGVDTLARFRKVASSFHPAARRALISWSAHRAARTPESLESIISGQPEGTRITESLILRLENARRQEAQQTREHGERIAANGPGESVSAPASEPEPRMRTAPPGPTDDQTSHADARVSDVQTARNRLRQLAAEVRTEVAAVRAVVSQTNPDSTVRNELASIARGTAETFNNFADETQVRRRRPPPRPAGFRNVEFDDDESGG